MVNTNNIENKMMLVLKFMFMKENSFFLKCCFSCNILWIKGCYLQLYGYFVGRCRADLFQDVMACLWRKLGGGGFLEPKDNCDLSTNTLLQVVGKKNTILWARIMEVCLFTFEDWTEQLLLLMSLCRIQYLSEQTWVECRR
jgi:hypothetical protein